MLCLEIVQSVLQRSELLATEEDEEQDDWATGHDSQEVSMELGGGMDDILNADTSNWDPFRDADKFEALAAAEQKARQNAVQAQFDLLKQQDEEQRAHEEKLERTQDLEASIQIAESRLEQKDAMLRQKESAQQQLLKN